MLRTIELCQPITRCDKSATGAEIETHQLQSSRLLIECLHDFVVGLLNERAECAVCECLGVRCLPKSADWRC